MGGGPAGAAPIRFGTDGLRGVAGTELTPELALRLGRAAARVLGAERWYVGRDPRRSGPLLQAALSAGLAAEGAEVVDLGVLPTPAVAHLAQADGVPAAMISASHNPFADNGIKLFEAGGRKLTDEVEARVEAELDRPDVDPAGLRSGAGLGCLDAAPEAHHRYRDHVLDAVGGRLGLASGDGSGGRRPRLVVDAANGAAAHVGPEVLRALGCDVVAELGVEPDGSNINDGCGSTHLDGLQRTVAALGADLGVAFDGDADRCLMVDHTGALVDGDQLLAVLALDQRERGLLAHDTVVVTVMSNLGFHLAMREVGLAVETTAVGDRYVLDRLDEGGFSLGGEQSGHVILRRLATTGDGLLTAALVLDVVARSGRTLADLAGVVTRLPQVLLNVRVAGAAREALAGAEAVWAEVAALEAELGERGRVLLRPSGTEPLVRVMVEAETDDRARAAAERLAATVAAALGA